MEDSTENAVTSSKIKMEEKKKTTKELVTKIFKNYIDGCCDNEDWVNIFWKSTIKRANPEAESIDKALALQTAVKLIKHISLNEYIPGECPPLPLWGDRLDELLQSDDSTFLSETSRVFCNFESLSSSFYPFQSAHRRFSLDNQTMDIDFNRLDNIYQRIHKISEEEQGVFEKIMEESIDNIADQFMKFDNKSKLGKRYSYQMVRILAIWLSQEILYEPQFGELITKIADTFFNFENRQFWERDLAMDLFKNLTKERFLWCFKVNQQHLTFTLMMEPDEEDTEEQAKIKNLFLIMDFFYYSSRKARLNSISLKEFHIDVINIEWKDKLKDFYIDWYNCRRGRFNNESDIDLDLEVNEINKRSFHKVLFIEYPWAFDAANKARLINYDGQIAKKKELHNSLDIASILLGGLSTYLKVSVRRDNLIEDSLNSLVSAGANLKKPLKVKFAGEPGVDEGGVQKEFFQLLVKQLFDVGYGMFEYNKESQLFWISRNSFEIPLKFELVGIILGLAIYNNHILDIHLPLAFYKKLLGKRVNLDDFEQYDPQVGKSLRAILNYDKEDFEEVMNLTFTVDYDSWGEKLSKELVENGSEINVTLENKEEYIDKYIHFLMDESVEKYFHSFKAGFEKWCGGEMLPRLEPEDLEMIICGSKILDFDKLKEATRYHDGYNENSETVKYFWQVVNEFTEEEKKKFLFFTTGCDKAPINGLGELRLTIIRHGDNEELLPSAHTCFNHLLLPCYSSAEKLKEKLLIAINNSEGFGLM